MKKRLKVIITLAVSMVLIAVSAITAFAWTQQSGLPGYGANFNTTHEENGCCPNNGSSVYGSTHYEEGYYQGYMDCYDNVGNGLDETQKQEIINEFLASADYQQRIDEAKAQGAEDYKKSEEYTLAILQSYEEGYSAGIDEFKASSEYREELDSRYTSGVKASYEEAYKLGYDDGAEQMYAKGVSDGYANFRSTEEYRNTLQAQYDGGYGEGYAAGVSDAPAAESSTKEKGPDISSIITLVLSIVVLSAIVVFVFTNKKFKGRKRK